MKRGIKLLEQAQEEYDAMNENEETVQPGCLTEAFPACKKGDELNVADVMRNCNFLFRDA